MNEHEPGGRNDPETGIAGGGGTAAPGIELEDFQLKYSDEATRRNIEMMAEAKQYSVKPFPAVVLNEEDAAEIARIQKELGRYAEKTMACFVTGDIPLDDENWKAFCDRESHLAEVCDKGE